MSKEEILNLKPELSSLRFSLIQSPLHVMKRVLHYSQHFRISKPLFIDLLAKIGNILARRRQLGSSCFVFLSALLDVAAERKEIAGRIKDRLQQSPTIAFNRSRLARFCLSRASPSARRRSDCCRRTVV